MKRLLILVALFTVTSLAGFTADGGSGKIHLDSPVKVGSTELPAGDYKVTWTGSGAQVTLTQGKTTATIMAQVLEVRHNDDAFATKNENGSRVLTEIQLHDKIAGQ